MTTLRAQARTHAAMRARLARQAAMDPGDGIELVRQRPCEPRPAYRLLRAGRSLKQLAALALRRKRLQVRWSIEAALASFLSPDSRRTDGGSLARRLDRLDRQVDGWNAISPSRRNTGAVRPLLADRSRRHCPRPRSRPRRPRAGALRGLRRGARPAACEGADASSRRFRETSRPRCNDAGHKWRSRRPCAMSPARFRRSPPSFTPEHADPI